jgi:hypothetical protein
MNLPSRLVDAPCVDERQGDDIMPSITKLRSGEVIFNVDHSVGRYGRNRMVDVQLVQLLLNLLIDTTKHVGPLSDPPLPAPEPLKLDGICGAKTIDAILWFQKSANIGYATYAEDATINNVETVHYGPSPGGKLYTLWGIQSRLERTNVLPRSTADIPVQPLASELSKWFDKGMTLKT